MTNKPLNDTIHRVTQRVIANSRDGREVAPHGSHIDRCAVRGRRSEVVLNRQPHNVRAGIRVHVIDFRTGRGACSIAE